MYSKIATVASIRVDYDKDQKVILLALIHRKDLAKNASAHLLDKLDEIHYEADRKEVQRELFNRVSAKLYSEAPSSKTLCTRANL